ncbi:bifunctional glutamate N-acetyltransferase/amino-acid acetyltransferase ArgJ [Saccharospirillum salsuginis]|uniref:Arginine biosynthesis bifunctional protein ArgJ n=1 Tax=Saccharospirillum salsuginis TaxID=418750 RepID=A0A918KN93_9GAMM|nr:bifunctional glutamate N-acetyltransferase/amino-acid acetyltransferase ArgJ [Saccharospirillum salsuginis]GGX69390.1 arginine biosynthesis bifunctional protein ArgJ [Saccharospirillum salsuginis]
MAVGQGPTGPLLPVDGVSIGVCCAGIKKPNRRDLVVFQFVPGTRVAGVFTTNAFCAAPVQVAREHMSQAETRFWVVNTGNANAGTGARGLADARETCARLAALKGLEPEQALPFSTGVIGEYLPMETIANGLPNAIAALHPDNWEEAAHGILTTDTRPKGCSRQFEYQGETITVTGIAKGSGMIKPNMATMLAYVTTNASVAQPVLQELLKTANEGSFNRITVDSDTSTNDACMLAATGKTGLPEIDSTDSELYRHLLKTVSEVMLELAQAVVRDGEGATKFVEVAVDKAGSTEEALAVAYTIAHSPLVKTALTASDVNWGRILAAVGRSGLDNLDVDKIDIWLDDVQIVAGGERAPGYTEEAGSAVVSQEELTIRVILNRGNVSDQVWTTDLSHEYIRINAEYRT